MFNKFLKGMAEGFLACVIVGTVFLNGENFEGWFHKAVIFSLVSIGLVIISKSE